ncbi:cadherin domain-containing protein [Labrenzia sp. PHM005]|uniref:cadherin domain-containing protein n=1 Tax=Labrenzia sp. PHM005 TaxID=2590016 RepID=UPI0011401171|nr:cadherin domain-containing protein [Labrenzia sp. PHM005]QDG76252.1 hypothetical protein FJ695_10415 [Labrenzia sp. PHM005]
MALTQNIFFSSQSTALEDLPNVAPVDISAINDIFTLSFQESGSFESFLASANYDFTFSTGLQLNLHDSSLGNLQIDYPMLLDIDLPDRITEGESFEISFRQDQLQVIDEDTAAQTGHSPATITAESLNFDGFSIDLFFRSERSGLSDISLLNTSFGSAFTLDNNLVFDPLNIEVPILELPAGDTSISPIDGVDFNFATPSGVEADATLEIAAANTFEPLELQLIETLADVTINPLELLSLIPSLSPLGALSETFEFPEVDILGHQVEAALEAVVFAPFISGGFGVVQNVSFTPNSLVDVEVFFEGQQVDSGFLSTDFNLTAPLLAGDANLIDGTLDGELRFDLGGEVALDFQIAPVGTIGFEALAAAGSITVDGEESSASVGPVFENSVTGASGTGSFNIFAPITVDLPDDFFPEVVVPFSIALDGEIPVNAQPRLLDGAGNDLTFSDPLAVFEGAFNPLALGQIQVVDDDTVGELLVRFSVDNGTLSADPTANVAVTGSGSNQLTLRGTAENLSAFLATSTRVFFAPDIQGNAAELQILTDDLSGNTTYVTARLQIEPEDGGNLAGQNPIVGGPGGEVLEGTTVEQNDGSRVDQPDSIHGGGGNDTIRGDIANGGEADTLFGGSGDDTIYGNGGSDFIDGGSGNDRLDGDDATLIGGTGDDVITGDNATQRGGAGNDTLTGSGLLDGGDGNDTLRGTGRLVGGSGDDNLTATGASISLEGGDGDDKLDGSADAEILDGGDGADTITSGGGADTITAGQGDDTVTMSLVEGISADGGAGTNHLILNALNSVPGAPVTYLIDLASGALSDSSGASAQALNFENLDFNTDGSADISGNAEDNEISVDQVGSAVSTVSVAGGEGNDTISVTNVFATTTLDGEAGDDVLEGGRSADILIGGAGADTLIGNLGDDEIFADLDDLFLDGGSGVADVLNMSGAENTGVLFIDLVSAHQVLTFGTNAITIVNFENVVGRDGGNDVLVTAQRAEGLGGDDIIAQAETATGGAGLDTYIFEPTSRNLVVDLSNGSNQLVSGVSVQLTGFERVITSSGNDRITASDAANILIGGAGNDTFLALESNDNVQGGDGTDTADYSGSAFGVTLDLTTGRAVFENGDEVTASGLERVIGSDGRRDVLVSGDGDQKLEGLGGDDQITSGGGNDDVEAGEGDDRVDLGSGDDTADLGAGNDYAETGDGRDNVDGGDGNDVIIAAGNLADPNTVLDDFLSGGDGDDYISGGDGDDILRGEAGNDILLAGAGFDEVVGGVGQDTFVISSSGGNDFTDFNALEDWIYIEGFSYSDVAIVEDFQGFAEIRLPNGKRVFTQSQVADVTIDRFLLEKPPVPAQPTGNAAPTSISISTNSIDENSPVATVVGQITVTDPDGGDTHIVSLVDDAGGLFALENRNLVVSGPLDYETATSRQITLRAVDAGGLSVDQTLTISVNDLPDTNGGQTGGGNGGQTGGGNGGSAPGGSGPSVPPSAPLPIADQPPGSGPIQTPSGVPISERNFSNQGTETASVFLLGDNEQDGLVAILPGGVGVQSRGPDTPEMNTQALEYLLGILGGTPEQNAAAETAANTWINSLPEDTEYQVRSLELTADQAASGPIVIDGGDTSTTREAFVIDVSGLPSGTELQINDVEFIQIIGDVRMTGGAGSNIAVGDEGAQYIVLGADDDELHGGGGDDTIGSEGGDDKLFGDAGNDFVFGGEGNDFVSGGSGDDRLSGDAGNDQIVGGTGRDIAKLEGASFVGIEISGPRSSTVVVTGADTDHLSGVELLMIGNEIRLLQENAPTDFDEAVYLALNSDVAEAVQSGSIASGLEHYQNHGAQEGRLFGNDIDEAWYLEENADVAAAVAAGLVSSGSIHFAAHGRSEGRDPNPLFDAAYYLAQNADVMVALDSGGFASAYDHFSLYGAAEGRSASQYFGAADYLAANTDVAAAVQSGDFSSAYEHFILLGALEGRSGYAVDGVSAETLFL